MSIKKRIVAVGERFSDLLGKIKDVSQISDTVKLKISNENILIYSVASTDSFISALKSYTLKTGEYFQNFEIDSDSLDFIISPASKLVKGLLFFDTSHPIYLDTIYKQSAAYSNTYEIRTIQFSNNKLKISSVSSENSQIRDLTQKTLDAKLDIKLSKWGFKLSSSDLLAIKKLSQINIDDRIISITLESDVVKISELGKWELEVDSVTGRGNQQISFLKKYLGSIDSTFDWVDLWIFETFVLVKGYNTNLMLSYEQDFSD